jgi:hypothetical protein
MQYHPSARVLPLREAFLIHMNDFEFERLLEIKLRQLLDPVTATPAPPRKRRGHRNEPSATPFELENSTVVPLEVFA